MVVRTIIALLVMLLAGVRSAGSVIAYWDFNGASLTASQGTGSITHNLVASSVSYVSGTPFNVPGNEPAGSALRISKFQNNGRHVDVRFDATGVENVILTFATQRDAWGFMTNQISVSSDSGATFSNYAPPYDPRLFWNVPYFDLSTYTNLNNNSDGWVRFTFWGGTGPNPGFNDLDNLLVSGDSIPTPEPGSSLTLAFLTLSAIARRKR